MFETFPSAELPGGFRVYAEDDTDPVEDPLLRELHNVIVYEGDYKKTELFIQKCLEDGLFFDYVNKQQPRPGLNFSDTTKYFDVR